MKKVILSLCCFCLITTATQAQKNFLDVNYIEVQGTAVLEIVPDIINLQIIINEKDTKNKIPLAEQEKAMLEKLNQIGIDTKKDLSMENLDSNFKRKKFSSSGDILLSKNYKLVVHDGKTASKVYTELEKIGISNISVISVDLSKMDELRKEVRTNAVKAAKEKAEYITKALNQTIGKALSVEEMNPSYMQPMMANQMMLKSSRSDEDTQYESDIDFNKIRIESTMLIRFELK